MWVRSQDRKRLMKCDNLSIRNGVGLLVGKFVIENNSIITLGVYSTEEKALKILDMLQVKLNSRRKGDLINAITLNPKISLNLKIDEGINILDDVFEMPQDSEV